MLGSNNTLQVGCCCVLEHPGHFNRDGGGVGIIVLCLETKFSSM